MSRLYIFFFFAFIVSISPWLALLQLGSVEKNAKCP